MALSLSFKIWPSTQSWLIKQVQFDIPIIQFEDEHQVGTAQAEQMSTDGNQNTIVVGLQLYCMWVFFIIFITI